MDARALARLALCALLVGLLAPAFEAQARKGKGKRPPAAAGKAKAGGGGGGSLLPGFDAGGAQGQKPAGPRGKAGTAAGKAGAGKAGAKPAPPPDPMKEADRVADEAEARRALESSEEKRLRELFALCDLDHNGWLSLREAELVLSFDRAEYRRADLDQDGRLVPREFAAQKTLVFARLGAPEEPAPQPAQQPDEPPAAAPLEETVATPAPAPKPRRREALALPGVFPRPTDLLQRYDQDASQALSAGEVERLLGDLGLDLSAPLVVAQMDPDKSGELAAVELLPLSLLASKHMPESMRPPPRAPRAEAEAPPAAPSSGTAPAEVPPARPSALAAMTPFGRLDRDRDGFISEQDLRSMEGLARLDARVNVLLSALDTDGDRRLSQDEFTRAMQDAPAGSKPSDQ